MTTVSPYNFVKRRTDENTNKIKKGTPEAYHDRLNEHRFDIAFEVEWKTETPTALNPCIATEKDNKGKPMPAPANIFGKDGEYAGYNNRWLMAGGKLAISPFTVKSAIANGFAAVMGGCLRVMDKVSGHSNVKQGVYQYNGVWKRYRVARDGSSKPGIVLNRQDLPNGDRYYQIMPVKEFYYDGILPLLYTPWKRGARAFITKTKKRGNKPSIIDQTGLSLSRVNNDDIEVEYQGVCDPDMYSTYRHHQHRFIQRLNGNVEGTLRKEQFVPTANALQEFVYTGSFRYSGRPWFQDLSKICVDDFVYYEDFNKVLTHIGKNFLFKALFYHPDTVPEGSEACTDMNHLCPRCAMFGMTSKNEKENEAVGFRGRFKAAALINNLELERQTYEPRIPVSQRENQPPVMTKVQFQKWLNKADLKDRVSRQILLPIMGPPKPNKRDVQGYYDPKTGEAKGAKRYLHAKMSSQDMSDYIASVDKGTEAQMGEYKHGLRPVAQVCREGLVFIGTVGAENCSVEEIAAMVMILDSNADGIKPHAFKLGLGKALGMGTVSSSIRKIWVRSQNDYKWQSLPIKPGTHETAYESLAMLIPDVKKQLENLKKVQDKLNLLEGRDGRELRFPPAGQNYWTDFFESGKQR